LGGLVGAGWIYTHRASAWGHAAGVGLGVVGAGCLVLGTILPLLLGARPSLGRPSTAAQLEITSPTAGEVFRGGPVTVDVTMRLEGGQVVPFTSLRLVPNEGHIHLYLDGALVSMATGLSAEVTAQPGPHQLVAEFVAVDHGPFDPPVRATVTFSVVP
jgi:hypothetical protein